MIKKFSKILPILCCLFLVGCACGPQTMSPKKATSRPYTIKGTTYYPQQHYEYEEEGVASHYGDGDGFNGKKTATGTKFDLNGMTAAHKTLPLPCIIRVTNLENGRSVKLKADDRGPFYNERVLDVSRKAAQLLGFYKKGLARVRVQTLVDESLALNNKAKVHLPVEYAQGDVIHKEHVDKKLKSEILYAHAHDTKPLKKPEIMQAKAKVPHSQKHGGLYVQAGSFSNVTNAKSFSNKMHHLALGAPAKLFKAKSNKKKYTVRFGPFSSSKDAKNLIKQINKSGCKDAIVVKE